MEERLRNVEREVVDLRIKHAGFDGALSNLVKAVAELRAVVQDLRDTVNQGRGALWLFGIGSAGVGTLIGMILKKWLG